MFGWTLLCQGDKRPCHDGSQSAACLHPEDQSQAWVSPLSPASGLSWNCSFHGGWDWTILRVEREREWAIANSPISHLSFSSSLQLLWAMERLSRPSPYLSVSQQKQSDFSLGRKLDICICSKKSRRVSAKHTKYPYGPERPLGFTTEGLKG